MPIDEGTGKIPLIDYSQELSPEDLKNILDSLNRQVATTKPLIDTSTIEKAPISKLKKEENEGIEKKNKSDSIPTPAITDPKNTEKPIITELSPAIGNIKIPKIPVKIDSTQADAKYIVKTGDTLYSLSRRFQISVTDLKSLNGITTDNIKVGQELIVKK